MQMLQVQMRWARTGLGLISGRGFNDVCTVNLQAIHHALWFAFDGQGVGYGKESSHADNNGDSEQWVHEPVFMFMFIPTECHFLKGLILKSFKYFYS